MAIDDDDEDEARAKIEMERNLRPPGFVPGDKVVTSPGDRIAYVMFVGQLRNMPSGYWVGVQYEEKVGKNDGTLQGKRIFTCPPGHGGFLRASKISSVEDAESKTAAREALAAQEAFKSKRGRMPTAKGKEGKGRDSRDSVVGFEEGDDPPERSGSPVPEGGRGRRMSLVAWATSRDSARGGLPLASGRAKRPPGSTHPYRVRVSGTGLSQSVVGSLAQFTIIAHDDEGNKRSTGGDNFTVVMRGRGGQGNSQPALVRTKLTDRSDGTYMCEYRPWMTGQYQLEVRLDDDPIRGSPFNLNVITLRPDAAQCQVRGEALHKAVARIPQKFDVLFVDASGHTAHAEELDVYVEPFDLPPQSARRGGGGGEARSEAEQSDRRAASNSAAKVEYADAPAAAFVAPDAPVRPPSPPVEAAAVGASEGVKKRPSGEAPVETVDAPAASASDGVKKCPSAEEPVPAAEPDGANSEKAAAFEHAASHVSARSPHGSARSARMKKLDAPTRQRHLQLWATRQASDKFQTRRAAETAFRDTGYGDEGKKKKKSSTDSSMPSFLHELSADKYGFAFGGVDPGTLHAHGKLIKTHHVSYSVGLAGRYKLHVGLRQQMQPLPGSPFTLQVEPGAAYAASTKLPSDKAYLTGMADEEWQHGLVLHTADMLGNLCDKGGANLTLSLPKRWNTEHERDENSVECRVVDNKDGSYTLSWCATLAGTFPLEVCIDGAHVCGSPISAMVTPAKPDVNRFVASGAGLQKAIAGVPAPMRIRVADRFDNVADLSASINFGLMLLSQAGAAAFGKSDKKKFESADVPKRSQKKEEAAAADAKKPAAVKGSAGVDPNAKTQGYGKSVLSGDSQPFVASWVNGCYEIKYVAEQAGVLDLNLWCEVDSGAREPLPGSPFSVIVSEGDASPVGSFVRDAEASKQGGGIIAGEHVILRPQVHDQFGNPSTAPENALTAILDSPGHTGEALNPPKLRSGLGSYELTLEPLKAGDHSVHILLHGEEITGSPVKFYVSPAAPNSQKCYLSRPDSEPILINTPCDILLTTHDKYGNQLDRGGVRVDAKAAGVAASTCTIEDHKDGTYTIRLTAGAPGEVKVTARIDSVEIKTLSVFFKKDAFSSDGTDEAIGAAAKAGGFAGAASEASAFMVDADGVPIDIGGGAVEPSEVEAAEAPAAADPAPVPEAGKKGKGKASRIGKAKGDVEAQSASADGAALADLPSANAPAAAPAATEPTGGADAPAAAPAAAKSGKGGKVAAAKAGAPGAAEADAKSKGGKNKGKANKKTSRAKADAGAPAAA